MRVGLLADIHGNTDALAGVLAAARKLGVERLLIAGDLVGYYYDAKGVLALLDGWDWVAVRGNHEAMMAAWIRDDGRDHILKTYGSAISVACETLAPGQIEILMSLGHPLRLDIEGAPVLLCHGAPDDFDAYVYPDAPCAARDTFFSQDAGLVVFGHTHYPVIWQSGATTVVNPGSVGQPRDRIPGACWALWDTDRGDVALRRETYDPSALIAACRRRDPGVPYLADVLLRDGGGLGAE